MGTVLTEFIDLLVGGISNMAAGIGSGLSELAKAVFLDGTGTQQDPYKLSVFGGICGIFAGIALAVGLSTKIVTWVTSLGN